MHSTLTDDENEEIIVATEHSTVCIVCSYDSYNEITFPSPQAAEHAGEEIAAVIAKYLDPTLRFPPDASHDTTSR